MANLSFYNNMTVRGYVVSFNIKEFATSKLANIGIEDSLTKSRTYVTLWNRKNLKYNGNETTLEGLKKIFMDAEGKPRRVLVEAKGRISETKGKNKQGEETTYANKTIFSIEPFYDESKQYATVILNGIVDGIKIGEDSNGESMAKVKIGVLSIDNRDKSITGCDTVTLVAHGEVAEELEDKGVERGCYIKVGAQLVNTLPERDMFGDIISSGKNEIQLLKIKEVKDAYEVEDFVNTTYKQAKKLKRGETISTQKEEPKAEESVTTTVKDELEDWDF